MTELLPNQQRAKTAILLVWLVFAMEIISLISAYFQYTLLQTVAQGGEVSMEAANANDSREQIIAIIYLIVYLVSAVTFIQWFRRAYYNIHQLVPYCLNTEGWAAGSWFVPILNLFKPYQIMKEIFSETNRLLSGREETESRELSISLIGWWWAFWLINGFLGQLYFRLTLKAETLDDFLTSTTIGMIGNLASIPLVIITVVIIRKYAAVEPLLHELEIPAEEGEEEPVWAKDDEGLQLPGSQNDNEEEQPESKE